MSKLKDIITESTRYNTFTLLDNPVAFNELFKDQNFDVVQLHSTQIIEVNNQFDIIGFVGTFKWEDNAIISTDGDSYSKSLPVIGYEMFSCSNDTLSGLDILVGESW